MVQQHEINCSYVVFTPKKTLLFNIPAVESPAHQSLLVGALLCWSLGLEGQGRGDPCRTTRLIFGDEDLLESGLKSGVPELSQRDLGLWFRIWGHRSLAGLSFLLCTRLPRAPGSAARHGGGGALLGVGAGSSATPAGRRCWRGGGGKVGGLSPPPPAPEATFGFIIGSRCCSIPLI